MSTVMEETTASEDDVMPERQPSLFPEMDDDVLPEHMAHYDEAIEKVRGTFQGVRVKVGKAPQSAKWASDASQAALDAVGGADEDSVTISSKLLDPKIESIAAVNAVCRRIEELKTDRRYTLPHIRPGIRLIKLGNNLDIMEQLFGELAKCKTELAVAAEAMFYDMPNIREHMKVKLKGAYQSSNYQFDPRTRYHLSWQPEDVYVPSYLRHNATLQEAAEKQIQTELRETMAHTEAQLAQGVFEMMDHLLSRLEGRRLLDRRHEIMDVEKKDGNFHVKYRDSSVKSGAKPTLTVVLDEDDWEARVSDDNRRKGFNDSTATRLFDEIEYFNTELKEIGLARGEMGGAFDRLKKLLQSSDRKTLPLLLKESANYREKFSDSLGKIGEKFLDLSVLKGKRDIVRSKAKSARFNDDKV